MWVFVISRKTTGAFTPEQELCALEAEFPKNVFKHVNKKRALVMIPVDVNTPEEVQLLADNPGLILGAAKLAWFQEDLREDILRTIEENEAKEKSTDDLKEEAMSGLADLLGSMGSLRSFSRRMPEEIRQQMRDHAKKCTDPDCGVNRILAGEDKGEKTDAAPAGGGPFQVGDIVRVRKWESYVGTNMGWHEGMERLLEKEHEITEISNTGNAVVDNLYVPLTQLDLVRHPGSEPASTPATPDSPQ